MTRLPGWLLTTLLSLVPSAVLAEEAVPGLDTSQTSTLEVQILGWSKDERRYALRVYDLVDLAGEERAPPFCKGYVNHAGKKFLGGLSFVLFEGTRRIAGWRIQDSGSCTPPEKARERLAKAKAALAEQGVDLTALGATLTEKPGRKPSEWEKGKKSFSQLITHLTLPHGPWASKVIEVSWLNESEDRYAGDGEETSERQSIVNAQVKFGSGKSATSLSSFRMGPIEWSLNMAGHWEPRFDCLFVSPSGKVLVGLLSVTYGNMRYSSTSRVLFAHVDLSERLGAQPPASAPAR
jgi:hypothetical protein